MEVWNGHLSSRKEPDAYATASPDDVNAIVKETPQEFRELLEELR